MRPSLLLVLLAALFFLLAQGAAAERRTVYLAQGVPLDDAGHALRRAVTAQEAASASGIPQTWTSVSLAPGEQVAFGPSRFLLLMSDSPPGAVRLLWVDDNGPRDAVLAPGDEADFGEVRVLAASAPRSRLPARLMLRASQPAPLLLDRAPGAPSAVRIEGDTNPHRLDIETEDPRLMAFALEFLRGLNAALSPEEAARLAREAEPPAAGRIVATRPGGASSPGYPGRGPYTDSTNMFDGPEGMPTAALVTLTLVRAEDWALRELSGSVAYDSAGRAPESPRVGASGARGGGDVRVGSPGDRWRGRLRALEASGDCNVEGETFVRVPLGGSSFFSFIGPTGGVDGAVSARLAGRRQADLLIDQRSGDWSFLGAVSTRARVTDGGTVTLARSSSSRASSSRSGPPLVGGVPFIGPMIGETRETRQSSSYALFATVTME